MYLVDVVTGSVIFHTSHKAAVSPVNLVHSENWIVVSRGRARAEGRATLGLKVGLGLRVGLH